MHSDNFKNSEENYEIVDIPHHMYGWGTLMIFDKRNWSIIPPALKVWYGDTWQFHMNDVPCRALKGLDMTNSNMSETVTNPKLIKEFEHIYLDERQWWLQNVPQDTLNRGI